jgi:hypothetical protein
MFIQYKHKARFVKHRLEPRDSDGGAATTRQRDSSLASVDAVIAPEPENVPEASMSISPNMIQDFLSTLLCDAMKQRRVMRMAD